MSAGEGTELPPSRVRFVEVDGTRIRVSERGEGRPLLLVMGIGGSLDMWEPLERALVPLGFRTITFDLPGSGGSPAVFPPLRMPGLARVAVGLLDLLGEAYVDVLGVSFGGAVAQEIARFAPERVRRLVLASTTPGIGGVPGSPRVLMHMSTPLRYWSPSYARRVSPLLYGGDARADADIHGRMAARFERPPSLAGYAGQLYAVSWWSSVPFLRRIRARTLVLHGDDDPILPLPNARILARLIPDATLQVVPGGGHLFLLDRADDAARAVSDFLAD